MISYFAIVHKDTDSAYGVHFPDLPGCFSAGDTIEAALANAKEALVLYLEDEERIPSSRDIDSLRRDPKVAKDLAQGGFVMQVPVLVEEKKQRINLIMSESLVHAMDGVTKNRSQYISDLVRRDIEQTGATVARKPVERGRLKAKSPAR